MAAVLHLLTADLSPLAVEAIERQLAAGDRVSLAMLEGAPRPGRLEGVTVHRVPEELGYADLLDRIFAADQVIAW